MLSVEEYLNKKSDNIVIIMINDEADEVITF